MLIGESWRSWPLNARYCVSSQGRVWDTAKAREIKQRGAGRKRLYRALHLRVSGQRRSFFVHRVVAETFLPLAKGQTQTNHKNGNRSDNRISNLEWTTGTQNMKHGRKAGLFTKQEKLNEVAVRVIRFFGGKKTQQQLADAYNVSQQTISRVLNGRTWKRDSWGTA